MTSMKSFLLLLCCCPLFASLSSAESFRLSSLNLQPMVQDYGAPQKNQSVDGHPLSIQGHRFEHGVGTSANSVLYVNVKKSGLKFKAMVGVDDEVSSQEVRVEFKVIGDGKLLWRSGPMTPGNPARPVEVDLQGVGSMLLAVDNWDDSMLLNHVDWAEAEIEMAKGKPDAVSTPEIPAPILTPQAPATPRINGPSVFGVRPGSPLLYTIPATGERPMTFSVRELPQGLRMDAATGQITGVLKEKGEFAVVLQAENAKGKAEKKFRISVGETLSLTPPMGWSSWNVWAATINQEKVEGAARAMIQSGLAQHGWTYINIDDTWQGLRSGPGKALQPNPKRFTDLRKMCDEIHALGLKAGIYSTPWVTSYTACAGGASDNPEGVWEKDPVDYRKGHHLGKYSFAEVDAKQWAEWGFDYLKYDWLPNDVPHTQEMAAALRATGRDIVFSLSNAAPLNLVGKWAALSQCWRTGGDIVDYWQFGKWGYDHSVAGIGFSQDAWASFAGPGHWNDPDMLVVGSLGWGKELRPSRLTPDEQYSHISLWCLLAAPLMIGCDLEHLDPFTLNLLTNDEVLAVDQDTLGRQAVRLAKEGPVDIYGKELEDGGRAVGFFNRGLYPITLPFERLPEIGLSGLQHVRDLWRQKALEDANGKITVSIPPHGVVLLKFTPVR